MNIEEVKTKFVEAFKEGNEFTKCILFTRLSKEMTSEEIKTFFIEQKLGEEIPLQ